jgi:hypothetical protein
VKERRSHFLCEEDIRLRICVCALCVCFVSPLYVRIVSYLTTFSSDPPSMNSMARMSRDALKSAYASYNANRYGQNDDGTDPSTPPPQHKDTEGLEERCASERVVGHLNGRAWQCNFVVWLVPLEVGLLLSLLWVGSMARLDCAWLRAWYEAMGTRFDCSVRNSDKTCAMLTRQGGDTITGTATGTQKGGRQSRQDKGNPIHTGHICTGVILICPFVMR